MSRVLESLVSWHLPTNPEQGAKQGAIVFVDRDGNKARITPRRCKLNFFIDFANRDGSGQKDYRFGSDADGNAGFYATATDRSVEQESRPKRREGGPKEWWRWHSPGHHCGGYHLGKNKRQTPSIRWMPYHVASELFGLPEATLASVDSRLEEIKKERERLAYEAEQQAMPPPIFAGNSAAGSYKF